MIVVGLSTTGHIASRIIRAVEKKPFSHAWMRFKVLGREMVYQSDHRGVNLEDFKRFERKNKIVKEYRIDLDFSELMDELLEQLGSKYDYGGAIGNAIVILGRALGRTWANPWQNQDRWYCSEVVAHRLEQAGFVLPCKAAAVTPGVLDQLLEDSKHAFRIHPA